MLIFTPDMALVNRYRVRLTLLVLLALLAFSCGRRSGAGAGAPAGGAAGGGAALRPFPAAPAVPRSYTDPADRLDHVLRHFWDGFLADPSWFGQTDNSRIAGIPSGEVEQAVGTYVTLLEQDVPYDIATRHFFRFLHSLEDADTSGVLVMPLARLFEKYLYDPQSPVRDDELWRCAAVRLSESPSVPDSLRPSYVWQARLCSLNRPGERAADFFFVDRLGGRHRFHAVRAPLTLLLFSNPDCAACRELVDALATDPQIADALSDGRIAVVSVYIDRDVEAWRAAAADYPASWLSGYDPSFTIRDDLLYSVRAIPSLYLLDAEKRVLLKDAPAQRVASLLRKLIPNTTAHEN